MKDIAEAELDRYIAFLKNLNAQGIAFFERDILSHLIGTYEVLNRWGSDPALIKAGLFHAVYLTEFFTTHSPTFENRLSIQSIIGTDAEALTYYYCTMSRPNFITKYTESNYQFHDNYADALVPLSKEQDSQLVELVWANSIEQIEHLDKPFDEHKELGSLFEVSKHRVGSNALSHYYSLK